MKGQGEKKYDTLLYRKIWDDTALDQEGNEDNSLTIIVRDMYKWRTPVKILFKKHSWGFVLGKRWQLRYVKEK